MAVWAGDTLVCLANTSTMLTDRAELLVCLIAFAADGPAFTLLVDDGD